MEIVEVDFDTILPVWRDKLWPERKTPIEPNSAMALGFGYNMAFMYETPTFLAGYLDNEIIAVNSCHPAEGMFFRGRGLWVDPAHRGKGLGILILDATADVARRNGAEFIWSFPRKSSIKTYEAAGYVKASDWLEDNQFGPNCYAVKQL